MIVSQDLQFLENTIKLADEAVKEGNHPFGAVLVDKNGVVLAVGKNSFTVDLSLIHI